MKAIIKSSFTKADIESGSKLVTPISFSCIKDWSLYEVSGDKYSVNKAVKLGAKKPKAKPKAKPKK